MFGRCASAKPFYIQQHIIADGWTAPHHPVMEGQYSFREPVILELNAESTRNCPERWYQNNSAIPAAGGDITLGQEMFNPQ